MLDTLRRHLAAAGLDHVGTVPAARWDTLARPEHRCDAVVPGARGVVVVANAGRALWDAFCADLRADPAHLAEEPHPLDAFVRRALDAAPVPGPHRWITTGAEERTMLDFRTLSVLAGLGVPSRLGLVIHPRVGTWMGLRAACFVTFDVPEAPPVESPCEGCPAPCVAGCPAGALASGSIDIGRCSNFHFESDACATTCHAREACPVGEPYPAEQLRYHYDRAGGRRWLRAHLGIEGDRHEGVGPHWERWR